MTNVAREIAQLIPPHWSQWSLHAIIWDVAIEATFFFTDRTTNECSNSSRLSLSRAEQLALYEQLTAIFHAAQWTNMRVTVTSTGDVTTAPLRAAQLR